MEEACLRAMKKMKAETESESLSLSNMSKTAWGHMSNACGRLSLKPTELPSGDHTDSATIPKFSWTDEPEGNQSDRCVLVMCQPVVATDLC